MQTVETLPVREAIETRRSIRQFVQEPANIGEIMEILRLASLAPSAWNVQPWRFVVVTDRDLRSKLQEAAGGQKQVTSAPAVILVVSDMEDVMANTMEVAHPGMAPDARQRMVDTIHDAFRSQSVSERGMWGLGQTYIALGFLLIAARGLGYGTVPMLGFNQGKVRELLGLADHIQFAAMVPIGHPAEEGYPHHRHPVERIVTVH